ncbi:hypothetical protein [Paenibacillus sp.]|uniref:hypothetical protein n=1 Tax=Paenibacillus sp. TaxID=58172 RepID=UPI002D5FC3B2|nr:hypothetical protein [Paenibacillus sp.]HZG88058.1 hypothetical protein [Paenibacillus sp.]
MNDIPLYAASIAIAVLLAGIACFQVLLFLGFPMAEYSWGGRHRGVLPNRLRRMSLLSAFVLVTMGLVFLVHARVLDIGAALPTQGFVWAITGLLGLNTLGNLASQSVKEKRVMTPLSGTAFAACLFVALNA